MIVTRAAHQGDVYIKAAILPDDVTTKDRENGKVILAYGEQTGHHHRFEDDNVLDYVTNDNRRFIVVKDKPAKLYHEEHDPIQVGPGTYEIFIARQWSDSEEEIRVID